MKSGRAGSLIPDDLTSVKQMASLSYVIGKVHLARVTRDSRNVQKPCIDVFCCIYKINLILIFLCIKILSEASLNSGRLQILLQYWLLVNQNILIIFLMYLDSSMSSVTYKANASVWGLDAFITIVQLW